MFYNIKIRLFGFHHSYNKPRSLRNRYNKSSARMPFRGENPCKTRHYTMAKDIKLTVKKTISILILSLVDNRRRFVKFS